ncbi:MAG: 16S rRNA (cytosine(1402)-N(4))-methyltransferase RsmH, partial [Pseudomonadota bacterium]|nr:16S rRNA (cytosine(1402)-N(4))-methyltransferase RsmH [Pseudomonadota bacterium]
MPPTSAPHIPVLLSEVVTAVAPAKGDVYLDGTFGAGGYTRAVLEAAGCSVLALDRDPQALADAGALVDAFGARLTLVEGCFGDMEALAQDAGFAELDGVMLDLGVSSMQLDQPARGFSFTRDGPLDMRMGATGTSAEELVNEADPALLVSILSVYGEERRARAIVRALVVRRETARITRTVELAEIVCSVLGQPRGKGAHPATRTFQA